jgi:hypothetical protein
MNSITRKIAAVAFLFFAALGVSAAEIAAYTGALDAVQNTRLPRTVDDVITGAAARSENAWRRDERAAAAGLKRLAEAVKAELGDPFLFLKKIFICF